ncbi:hypothetical protein Tco_1135251 [Tanacetum coccineum]
MVTFLEKSTSSEGLHQVIDFLTRSHICYALTKKLDVCVSYIKQFWRSAEVTIADNGEVTITATIDGHSMTLTEASLRRHLKLNDQDGVTSIPNSDPKKTAWEQFSSNIATAVICLATNRKYNFSRMIFEHMVWSNSEDDLRKTKKTYSSEFTKLILKVKKLEARVKIGKSRRRAKVVLSEDDEDIADDSSKQGRKLSNAEVQDKASNETEPVIQDVTPIEVIQDQESSEKGSAEVSTAGAIKDTAREEVPIVSTAEVNLSTAGGNMCTYTR